LRAAAEFEDDGWIPRFPGRAIRSFHINAVSSPWARWSELVQLFIEAKEDRELLQVFVNTVLGETWEERGQRLAVTELEARAEVWVRADKSRIEVPDGVGVLCAGVDVQGDRFELLVRGYGVGWETWDIFHERIVGDIQVETTQARLRALLFRTFEHAGGRRLPIAATMIDSGYEAVTVYGLVDPLESSNVWASKGDDGSPKNEILTRGTRPNRASVTLWSIGTFKAKKDLFNRLRPEIRPGPRFVHLRKADQEYCNGFDAEYFAQFGAEKIVVERGVPRFRAIRERNEAIDLQVLADSAFRGLGTAMLELLPDLVERARQEPDAEPEAEDAPMGGSDGGDWATGGGQWGRW
jgi:phage terminase large subunit GpA-like protein